MILPRTDDELVEVYDLGPDWCAELAKAEYISQSRSRYVIWFCAEGYLGELLDCYMFLNNVLNELVRVINVSFVAEPTLLCPSGRSIL